MQTNLSSGNYNIISTGMTFLFGEDKDLKIEVTIDSGFRFAIIMEFRQDESDGYRIDGDFSGDVIRLLCYNFKDSGTGMCGPVKIGRIEGKDMFLMFWSYLDGDKGKKARSVKYTIFLENR